MKIIKGNLVLKKDTVFDEDLKVEGHIITCENLIVRGDITAWNITAKNIHAWDINAEDITAWDIDAWDITAKNIHAWDINARNILAWDIICESRKKKSKTAKTIARIFITDKSKLEWKEW